MLTTPGGSSSASKISRQHQRRQRRLLGRLEHRRAAAASAGRQLPRRHQQRVVPGDDLPDHADGLAQHQRQGVVGDRQRLAVDLAGEPAVVLEAVRGVGDVELGLDDRLAHVAGVGLGQRRPFLRGSPRPPCRAGRPARVRTTARTGRCRTRPAPPRPRRARPRGPLRGRSQSPRRRWGWAARGSCRTGRRPTDRRSTFATFAPSSAGRSRS